MAERYITKEGLEKLKEELHYLETTKRKEVAEKLRHAIGFGDLSENAAYDEAKDSQAFLEGKIKELRDTISEAKIVEKKSGPLIQIGSTVLVDLSGMKEKYEIVGPEEADILKGKISHKSPLGQVLLGRKKGDNVEFETPGGVAKYKILEVE